MRKSILRQMFAGFMVFGISMGLIFPYFAYLFVNPKEGMALWFAISCLVAGIIMGLFTYALMKMVLINKLKSIAKVANRIRDKDLSRECVIVSDDVIGDIVDSFNEMSKSLRQIISDLHEHTRQIETSVTEVASVSADTAQGADIQYHAVYKIKEEIAVFMESTESIAKRILESISLTTQTIGNVDQGNNITNQTMATINELADHFNEASTAIVKLRSDIESISSILEMIDSISEQTNLLALNAAIEAARAGEQGRGFAVVADEVRQLAQRTHDATSMTKEKISALQEEADSSVQMMERSTREAGLGVKTVTEIKKNFENILNNMKLTELESKEISAAAEQQLATAGEISNNIDSVSSLAKASQSGSQGSACESEKLKSLTRKLEHLFDQFILDEKDITKANRSSNHSDVVKVGDKDDIELF